MSDKEYGDLVKAHLQQQVDGGASAKTQADGQKPSLEDAAVQAIQDGKDVQASTSDGGGATKSINVKALLATAIPGSGAGTSDTFEVGNGSTLVQNFKDVFKQDNSTILVNGQFNITNAVEAAIIKTVELKTGSDAGLNAVWTTLKTRGQIDFDKLRTQNSAIKSYIDSNNLGTQYSDISDLFKPHSGDAIQKMFGDFWIPATIKPPPTIAKPTFDLLQKAYDWEKAKCGYVAQMLASKYVKKKNAPLPTDLWFDLAGILKVKITPDNLSANSADPQIFTNYDTTQLKTIMGKVENSLKKNRPVVVGVMSGINHTDNGVSFSLDPDDIAPEHYILIFAQDGPDKFFFWDPDDQCSNIEGQGWGPGFGVLFYRKDRIGTAFSDADLTAIETQGELAGDHTTAPKRRHRYQAYYLRNGLSFPKDKVIEKLKYDPDTGKAVP